MRQPLRETLDSQPELAAAETRRDLEAHVQALFERAGRSSNAYTAERLAELYEVTDRALALADAFPPSRPAPLPLGPGKALVRLLARYGGGLLLAGAAPLLVETSVLLAVACGVGAALNLLLPPQRTKAAAPEKPREMGAKLESFAVAADRSLRAMTAPRALEGPKPEKASLPADDVLSLLQDTLMLEGEESASLRENAERLAARAGFDVIRTPRDDLFEVMVDPGLSGQVILKPALVARDGGTSVPGVIVRGQR